MSIETHNQEDYKRVIHFYPKYHENMSRDILGSIVARTSAILHVKTSIIFCYSCLEF